MKEPTSLYLFTDAFPYGPGEKSFILPELAELEKHYAVTILTGACEADRKKEELTTKLSPDVTVIPVSIDRYHVLSKAVCVLRALRLPVFRAEARRIRRERGGKTGKKMIMALGMAAQAIYFLKKLEEIIELEDRPVLLYSFWNQVQTLAFLLFAEKHGRDRFRVVSRTHGYDLYNERVPVTKRQPYKQYFAKHLDGLFFACGYAKDYFVRSYCKGKSLSNLQTAYLGTPAKERVSRTGTDGFHILSCSNVIPLKRVGQILEALLLFEEQEPPENRKVIWTHVGDGPGLAELQLAAEEAQKRYPDLKIRLTGRMDNEDLMRLYETEPVDCFLTTTSTEGGVPVSMQEAASFGVPLIGTRVGGVPEIIDGSGILLDADAGAQETADALRSLYRLAPEEKAALRARSLELWAARFDAGENSRRMVRNLALIENGEQL